IGVKMLLPLFAEGLLLLTGGAGTSSFAVFLQNYHRGDYDQLVINMSLGVIVAALALSVVLSIVFPKHSDPDAADDDMPATDS
ncbi:MAG TPA: hypothetical protein VGQ55_09290, partial [Pyrinomonadaceae bacterium]|nr:hypothetical protein [Pyrinomonadaceae bacterium]